MAVACRLRKVWCGYCTGSAAPLDEAGAMIKGACGARCYRWCRIQLCSEARRSSCTIAAPSAFPLGRFSPALHLILFSDLFTATGADFGAGVVLRDERTLKAITGSQQRDIVTSGRWHSMKARNVILDNRLSFMSAITTCQRGSEGEGALA